jgi:mannose-1-phosphate guanylyltransferase
MVTKAMVMAAGVGSRLDPLTQDVPKPLVPIANISMMDILFSRLKEIGVNDVIANVYYMADKIIDRYNGKNNLGINFSYIKEDELSGTAGGVKKTQFFFEEGEDFLVLSADGLHNADLKKAIELHKNSGAIASLGVKPLPMEEIPNFGVVVTDENGFITEFQEKPSIKEAKSNLINTGIYIFNYEIFNHIPENTFYDFAKNVFPSLMEKHIPINTFSVEEYWSDIGTIGQYMESNKDVFRGEFTFNHSEILEKDEGKYIVGKSYISPSVTFKGFNIIGNDCIVGKNVVLENAILWDNVEIKDNVIVKDSVVASGSEIGTDLKRQTIGPNQILLQGVFK